ncbi:MAG TPA: tail fiber domain-containing protein [Polyangia bacterium]|nr:tail fiber domain-containing protein [Polyangia bacterium]HVZ89193.1 tail fiber domain-containing protein [Polyangia bacterium]
MKGRLVVGTFLSCATFALAGAGTARAQWSGTNPLTTSSVVGIGTTTPHETSELSGGSLVRLRVNSTKDGSGNGNGGIRLSMNETNQWTVGNIAFVSGLLNLDEFQIYDEQNSRNAFMLFQSATNNQASFNGDVVPLADNTYKLGISGFRWSAVWAANGTIQTSDARLKQDVRDIKYGLPEILKLRPVTFRWKSGDDTSAVHMGLIAQETEKVVPEAVVHGAKASDPLGMEYTSLIPVLVKAIQTQQKTIDQQNDRIARLERKTGIGPVASVSNVAEGGMFVLGNPAIGWAVLTGVRRRRRSKSA